MPIPGRSDYRVLILRGRLVYAVAVPNSPRPTEPSNSSTSRSTYTDRSHWTLTTTETTTDEHCAPRA
jgi:hypothetical protein